MKKNSVNWKLLLENFVRFLFNVGFAYLYQFLFGGENILAGVAICVALSMLPFGDLGIRPLTMAGITFGLFAGCGLVSQLALVSPWLALPFNLLFVLVILLLTGEPAANKPSISFLLCFVFCQATPVSAAQLPRKMAGILITGFLTAAVTYFVWKKRGYGAGGVKLRGQLVRCAVNKGYLARMSIGIAAAMFIGMSLHLIKPLWISIVVMSLTQLDFQETVQRIKHRSIGTVFGIAAFLLIFGLLVPQQYAMLVILLLGYLSFFTQEYKYKTIVNAINAINASLILLDTTTAIESRVLCLLAGIAIVLALWLAEHIVRRLREGVWLRSRSAG